MSFSRERIRRWHSRAVKEYVNVILSHPKAVILIPSLIIFVFSYNVLYDYLIKSFNYELQWTFTDHKITTESSAPELALKLNQLSSECQQMILYKISIIAPSNLLTYQSLNSIKEIINKFESLNITSLEPLTDYSFENSIANSITVISPLTFWPIELKERMNLLRQKIYIDNVMKLINEKSSNIINSFFLQNVAQSNNLIVQARELSFYIIQSLESSTDSSQPILTIETLQKLLPNIPAFQYKIVSTSKQDSIHDFINGINLIINPNYDLIHWIFSSSGLLLILSSVFAMWLIVTVMNQYKIRSKFGLLIGWLVEVMISAASGVVLTSYIFKVPWKDYWEPQTNFARFSFSIYLMFTSSSNMLMMTSYLSGESSQYEAENSLKFKLYKFYNGGGASDQLVTRSSIMENNSDSQFKTQDHKFLVEYMLKLLRYFDFLPSTMKTVIITCCNIAIVKYSLICGLAILMDNSPSRNLLITRIKVTFTTLTCSIIIDHFLQIFYLTSIIAVDMKRVELTDLLAKHSFEDNVQMTSGELIGVNYFSKKLLKLDSPPSFRPKRSSYRHRIGQALLKFKAPMSSEQYMAYSMFGLIALTSTSICSWLLQFPWVLNNDPKGLYTAMIMVEKRKYDIIYYLELMCVVVIILAIAGLSFKFTNQENNSKMCDNTLSEPDLDFENDSQKCFQSIDLIKQGHALDIIKVKASSSSPFIVTVGLDHKILIWSPLKKPEAPKPINIGSVDNEGKENWPINHVNISNDGNYIILSNLKDAKLKCYERKQMKYIWEIKLTEDCKNSKVLESFFRKRTVPGFLTRKILRRKKAAALNGVNANNSRRASIASEKSIDSSINGNYQAPSVTSENYEEPLPELNRDDYMVVYESGNIATISCQDGSIKVVNALEAVYKDISDKRLYSAKKLSTARVCDRIVCLVDNNDIVVVSLLNNKLHIKKLNVQQNFYNSGIMVPLMPSNSLHESNDFESVSANQPLPQNSFSSKYTLQHGDANESKSLRNEFKLNRPLIVTIEFVGMIIRVRDLIAELIDIQTGIVLKSFQIGHFKSKSFRVSHSEPTHCKFCGCASIQSLSLIYQEQDSDTLIMHTFRIDTKKSKNNICLRVERDPREIRCLGFNAVTEHQHWYENVEKWEVTDINMIIGIKRRREHKNHDKLLEEEIVQKRTNITQSSGRRRHFDDLIDSSRTSRLRSRLQKNSSRKEIPRNKTLDDIWEGFIINAKSGVLMDYKIPSKECSDLSLSGNKIVCMEKFGYKSAVVTFGNLVKILYLGSDKLIEKDLYYSGTNTSISSVFPPSKDVNLGGTNNGLLFINKRRMHRERNVRSREDRKDSVS